MSTVTTTPLTLDLSGTKPVPFSRLVKVELRKSYDTRAGFWLLASMGILTLIVYTVMLLVVAFGSDQEFSFGEFVGGAAFGTAVLLPVMAILLVTSEWSQRTAITSFTLETNRGRLLLAKLVTGLLLTFAVAIFAVVAGAGANLINAAIAGPVSWEFGWNYFFGFLATQSLAMLGGFALATLLLNSPAAIVAFFVYKWVVPTIFMIVGNIASGFKDVLPWIDFQTAQAPLGEMKMHGSDYSHLLVTGVVWLVIPFAFGLWRVLRAEVK